MPAECPAMAKVFVTRALPFPALDRLREAHEVDEWPGDLPPGLDELRARAREADGLLSLVTDRVDAAAARRRAAAEGDRQHGGRDRQHRPRGGRRARHPGRQHARRADRRHRRPRLRAAARAGAPDRAGRRDGALGRVADVGAGRRPRRRPRRAPRSASSAGAGSGRRWRAAPRASGWRSSTARARPACRSRSCSSGPTSSRVHTPLTPETRHLIDADALARMKPTALLVNTARGGVVDQDALRDAPCTRERSPAPRSTSPTPSRCPPTTRCSTRRTCWSCRTSARPPCARVRRWRRWRSTTCWRRSTAARCRYPVA